MVRVELMATILGFWNKKKHQSAIEQIVGPHIPSLYRLAFRLTGSEADSEDLLQDLVVKMRDREDELLALEKPAAWLSKVLYRLYIDGRRRRNVRPVPFSDIGNSEQQHQLFDQADEGEGDPATQFERHRTAALLQHHLDALPEQQRVIVVMHDIEGFLQSDIADVLGLPLGTVKSRLHRARRELREKLIGTF